MEAEVVPPEAIFSPMFTMFALTFLVWVYMYVRRIRFITVNRLSPIDLAVPGALARLSPASVSNPSDNFQNLFEIPVIFYALVLYLYATRQVDLTYLVAAWVFVGFRALHSALHDQCRDPEVLSVSHLYGGGVVHRRACCRALSALDQFVGRLRAGGIQSVRVESRRE